MTAIASIPNAVTQRAADLGCRIFWVGDDPEAPEASVSGPYVLRSPCEGRWNDVLHPLPLAGIAEAIEHLEQETLRNDPSAWRHFGEEWAHLDEHGRAMFVARKVAEWAP
jgi:hypothetical protein